MAFKIRTGYEGDLSLFKTPQSIASYGALFLALCAAPFFLGSYFLSQIVFVQIGTSSHWDDRLGARLDERVRPVPLL